VTHSAKSKKKENHYCSVCSQEITLEEFEKHNEKCQRCWTSQLAADLEEMFGDLDAELILRGSVEN
jgi:hypothetical protein